MEDNFTLNISDAVENKSKLALSVRLILAKKYPSILKKYFELDDSDFLNPLIFACLNNENDKLSTEEHLITIFDKKYNYSCLFDNMVYMTELPTYIQWCFSEMYRGEVIDPNPTFKLNYSKIQEAVAALESIKTNLPKVYEELIISNELIVFHDNSSIINFVTKSFNGALIFWIKEEITDIHFIEEFIHQGAHNFLNLILNNKEEFFRENPENIQMSEISSNSNDYRSLMSAIHGLYTVVKRIKHFKELIDLKVYDTYREYELFGRYADQLIRFKNLGVYDEVIRNYLTERGLLFYDSMVNYGNSVLNTDSYLIEFFNLDWREIDFYFSEFAKHNSYENFKTNLLTQ